MQAQTCQFQVSRVCLFRSTSLNFGPGIIGRPGGPPSKPQNGVPILLLMLQVMRSLCGKLKAVLATFLDFIGL